MDSKLFDEDVPDPTDFPPSAPGLMQLDDALRCRICRELFRAPVTVNCPSGHCFCSVCIRTNMAASSTSTCPLCRESVSEIHLRKNQSMEDAVKAWEEARPFVLNLVRSSAEESPMSSVPPSQTSSTGIRLSQTPAPTTPRKKRKAEETDDDIVLITTPKKVKARTGTKPPKSSQETLVVCPACNEPVPEKEINAHLDRGCASSSISKASQKQQWSKFFDGAGNSNPNGPKTRGKAKAPPSAPDAPTDVDPFKEPIPKVAYDVISLRRLKELLHDYNLPDTGDRATLIARHQEWVILFNANRDASPTQRASVRQLKEQLTRWEKEQEERERKRKAGGVDVAKHQETYGAMFKQLTATARRTAKQTRNTPETRSSAQQDELGRHSRTSSRSSQVAPTPTPEPVVEASTEGAVILLDS